MIVYKWVIRKDDLFYPLRNYGIDDCHGNQNHPPYELNKTYKTKCKLRKGRSNIIHKHRNALTYFIGFHFWKEKKNDCIKLYNDLLSKKHEIKINAILECEIDKASIYVENDFQLVSSNFIVKREVK